MKRDCSCVKRKYDYITAYSIEIICEKQLTHISLVVSLWDIGKQHSSRMM